MMVRSPSRCDKRRVPLYPHSPSDNTKSSFGALQEFCTLVAPAMHASDKAGVLDAASTKEQVMNATRSVAAGTLGFKNDVDRIRAMVDNDRWVINPHGKFMRTWDQAWTTSMHS